MSTQRVGRNDPCPCRSGKKYKHCCGLPGAATNQAPSATTAIAQIMQSALAHHQGGRLAQAEALYRQVLEMVPEHPDALHLIGLIAYKAGKHGIAAELIGKAVGIRASSEMLFNLAIALRAQGQLGEAILRYGEAIALKSDYPEAHSNLAVALQQQGKLVEAVASCRRALALRPNYANAQYNLGLALQDRGALDETIASYARAIALDPSFADAYHDLGRALKESQALDAAIQSYRAALALKPELAEAYGNLGNTLKDQNRFAAAAASYRKLLALNPYDAGAHNNLGTALQGQGEYEAAVACYRSALALEPRSPETHSNLRLIAGYQALLDPAQYLELARGWEQACLSAEERRAAQRKTFRREPLAGRRLKVGYVSGDFRQHAVSFFIEQIFAHHDRSRIELFAYSSHSLRDTVTERLQGLAEHWLSLVGVSDEAAVARIEQDGIDVLIDLSGYTAHNRLGVFARRAAPVQAYYLGYFASTGLTEMDYWIGDEIVTPPQTDAHFSEQVWRLPRVSWSYDGRDAPAPNWRPHPDGTLWLGSFNQLGKLTAATLALWAQALHALPRARLLLKTRELADPVNRQHLLDIMAGHGIAAERIELQDGSATPDWAAHMASYDSLDIALDPIGAMGGVTTTCDALWMAVPVITLAGDRVSSRASAALLAAIGHPEWVASSAEEYLVKVVALAADVEQRRALRAGQRQAMASSPLCDAVGLTRCLEDAYLQMFERRCA